MPIAPAQGTAPAKRAAPRKSGAATSKPVTATTMTEAREAGLNGLGAIGQAICVMRGLYADAGAIGLHWKNVSRETAALATQNETIAKGVDYLISAGPYAGILTAVIPFGLQIAANHDRIDAEKISGFDIVPPAALEAQVKAEAIRKNAEAMRQAQKAQQETERLTAELAQATQNGAVHENV